MAPTQQHQQDTLPAGSSVFGRQPTLASPGKTVPPRCREMRKSPTQKEGCPRDHHIFVDLVKRHLAPREVPQHDRRAVELVDRFQPWSPLIVSGDNHEPVVPVDRTLPTPVDAIHAAEFVFGSVSAERVAP